MDRQRAAQDTRTCIGEHKAIGVVHPINAKPWSTDIRVTRINR